MHADTMATAVTYINYMVQTCLALLYPLSQRRTGERAEGETVQVPGHWG